MRNRPLRNLSADDFDLLDEIVNDHGRASNDNERPIMRDRTAMALCVLIAIVGFLAIWSIP